MGKGSKSGACKLVSHQLFKDRAKNRVDDLQGMFSDLQSARKDSRTVDVSVLEEQVHQMLREWQSELNQPSPASSVQQGGSLNSLPSDIYRLLQHFEEEDDATSVLAAPKSEPDAQRDAGGSATQEGMNILKGPLPQQHGFDLVDQRKTAATGVNNIGINNANLEAHLGYQQCDFSQQFGQQYFPVYDGTGYNGEQLSNYHGICTPPPSAFMGPKCALWDCPRPALGLDWSLKSDNYCSIYHSTLAPTEGYLGNPPVVRPGGIGLKDNLLFAALDAKALGKEVGVPECAGAATAKSPWNATELFDLGILEGETIREWLFFDKPRRAFESGNRKQRSLPDYIGRGWHESRKQVMNEFGGLKRSYYMDPQPMENYEWHLYEYEINKYDTCALYRLEVKRADGKKMHKGKVSNNDSLADLQKQMRGLTAEVPSENQQRAVKALKGRGKANMTNMKGEIGSIYPASNAMTNPVERLDYDYLVDNIDGYYIT